jgi:serine/threonine-protein kinase
MASTVSYRTPSPNHSEPGAREHALVARYKEIAGTHELRWATHYRKLHLLGSGGQGAVYLAHRLGANGFDRPVSLKVFSPESYRDAASYQEDMANVGQIAARVARTQHDNVVDIHDFIDQDGIGVMEMEWLDGYDLRAVLSPAMLEKSRERLPAERWRDVNRVILTAGPVQTRLKPGVAIAVLRDCLVALAALHKNGIVHGDLKPGNIFLKRTGNAKIIDIGSAIEMRGVATRRMWSPAYAAPEVLQGDANTPRSDLASLGYVLVEMLAGRSPFEGLDTYNELIDAKANLGPRLAELLPPDVSGNDLLLNLCLRLVSPDPAQRFASAQAADVGRKGAADFQRQLVKGDLASEYDHDIRLWLENLV